MAMFKCKMCGGDLCVSEATKVIECDYCGTKQTIPSMDNEKKINLFKRANRLRFANEFDKAALVYESIVAEFSSESEAYWGLCLCKYGIEYVDDPRTAQKVPTCHRTINKSIFDDDDFQSAISYSDSISEEIYNSEAKEIDRLQKESLVIASKEEPFDIFICYKETAEDGQRTKDSVLAQDMYDKLTEKGYKIFFSRITLEDKLGKEYEPYIYSALNSAKIMLCVGTKNEHFEAVWVKNEWNRFLNMMKSDKDKVLIPCYEDMDAYDMPKEFKNLQGQDMSKIGFMQDLVRGIEKIIPLNRTDSPNSYNNTLKIQNNIKFSKCTKCGSVLPAGTISCSHCYSQEMQIISVDDAYKHFLKLAENYSENNIKLREIEEVFKSNNMSKDFRYHHLCFINLTSTSQMYDCYSFDRPDAVECINKAIKSASGKDKQELKDLLIRLNEKTVEERREMISDSLTLLKKGKKKNYGYADEIYAKEIKSVFSLPINYYDFDDKANKSEENIIKSKRRHMQKYSNELNGMRRRLKSNMQQREQALYVVKERERSTKTLEVFHKYVIWAILILGYIVIENAMPNGTGWFGVEVGWTVLIVIVKIVLYFVQNSMESSCASQRKNIDIRYKLSAADILVIERYHGEFEKSISDYNEQIKKDESLFLQNKKTREYVRKLCADTYLKCISDNDIDFYSDAFKDKMDYESFIDKYSSYKKLILKVHDAFKKNFPMQQIPALNKIDSFLPPIKPEFSPYLSFKDADILYSNSKLRDRSHELIKITEENERIKSDVSKYDDYI